MPATTPITEARQTVARLAAAGHLAYWVGGCVRDLLLGREPKDFDIATAAQPQEVLALFPGSELVGAHFGVVLLPNGIEVATFRSEAGYVDGRRPGEVRFETSPRLDAARRDFTINALYYDPLQERVHDFVGGRADLSAGIIRAIGNPSARFAEDHLRLLRAVRFAARFQYTIEPGTLAAMRAAAPLLPRISGERILAEMNRMLSGPNLPIVWLYLDEAGLWRSLAPDSPAGGRLARLRSPVSTALGWAALLEAHPRPQLVYQLCRFPASLRAHCAELLAQEPALANATNLSTPALKRLLRQPTFPEHLELHRATYGESPAWQYLLEAERRWQSAELWPPPLLTGADLIALGLKPGPLFGNILEQLEDAQLEQRISTREEALALVRRLSS